MSAGSEAERITRMILSWEEQNPNTPQEFKDNLDKIGITAMEVSNMLKRFNLTLTEQGEIMKGVSARASADAQKMLSGHKWVYDYAIKAAKETDTERERLAAAEERRDKAQGNIFQRMESRVQGWSRTAGWMGYRLMMMGRVITRWFTQPLAAGQKVLINWEQTMMTVATSMGMAAMFGRDYSESLGPLLEQLPMIGIEAKAAQASVQAMGAGIATMFSATGTDAMWMFADSLERIWASLETAGVPAAFDEFVKTHLPALLTAIEDFVPGFATGLVTGLEKVTPLLTTLLDNVDGEALGELAGWLLPLAPALMALGTALFFLSPALKILEVLFGILGWATGSTAAGAAAGGVAGAAGTAGAGAGAVAAIPLWVPVLAALTGGAVGVVIIEALKSIFPWAVTPDERTGPGPAGAGNKLDLWKMLWGPEGEQGGQVNFERELAIAMANQPPGQVNIYGDIHMPETMSREELIKFWQDIINSQTSGYPDEGNRQP